MVGLSLENDHAERHDAGDETLRGGHPRKSAPSPMIETRIRCLRCKNEWAIPLPAELRRTSYQQKLLAERCGSCNSRLTDHKLLGPEPTIIEPMPKENKADVARQGGRPRGEAVFGALLNDEKVRTIRQRLSCGENDQSIAEDFGVDKSTINVIRHNRTWKHVVLD